MLNLKTESKPGSLNWFCHVCCSLYLSLKHTDAVSVWSTAASNQQQISISGCVCPLKDIRDVLYVLLLRVETAALGCSRWEIWKTSGWSRYRGAKNNQLLPLPPRFLHLRLFLLSWSLSLKTWGEKFKEKERISPSQASSAVTSDPDDGDTAGPSISRLQMLRVIFCSLACVSTDDVLSR